MYWFVPLLASANNGTTTCTTTIAASGTNDNGGSYNGVYLTISDSVFNDASNLAVDSQEAYGNALDLDTFITTTVSLEYLTIYSRNYTTNFSSVNYLTITGSFYNENNELESSSYTISSSNFTIESVDIDSAQTTYRAQESLIIDFTSSKIELAIGEQYFISFYNSSDALQSLTLAASSQASKSSDGTVILGLANNVESATTQFSPAGMTVVLTSTMSIPEPTTASLSLVALAGLIRRRRRQA